MDVPLLRDGLALRLEAAAIAWSRAWLSGVEGIEWAEVPPHVLAPCHRDRPDLDFQNRVHGLTPADAGLVPALAAWYAGRGIRPWFELVPSDDAADLLAALAAAGVVPVGFHGVVYGPVTAPTRSSVRSPAHDAEVDVQVVDPADDDGFATFCRTRVAGHELPAAIAEGAAADLAGWRHATGATLYLATVDGEAAATAALTVDGATAYLADGATVPGFRGRGLQSLLIRRRLDDGQAAGAAIACSQASLAGTSHRNLQRGGLTGGFTKSVLRAAGPLPPDRH